MDEHTGVRNGVGARGWLKIPVSDDTTSTAHTRARRKRTTFDTAASLSFATYRNRKEPEAEMLHLGGPDAFASRGDEHSRFAHDSNASSESSQRASLPGLEECSQIVPGPSSLSVGVPDGDPIRRSTRRKPTIRCRGLDGQIHSITAADMRDIRCAPRTKLSSLVSHSQLSRPALHRSDELSDTLVNICMARFVTPRDPERCMLMDALWLRSAHEDLASAARDARLATADFLYVPIWEAHHWVGAIVCRLSAQRYRALIVDSLYGRGSPFNSQPHCELLAQILHVAHVLHGSTQGMISVDSIPVCDAPLQPNLVDCALYMVMYFVKHSSALPEIHLQDKPRWSGGLRFRHSDVEQMRCELRCWVRSGKDAFCD